MALDFSWNFSENKVLHSQLSTIAATRQTFFTLTTDGHTSLKSLLLFSWSAHLKGLVHSNSPCNIPMEKLNWPFLWKNPQAWNRMKHFPGHILPLEIIGFWENSTTAIFYFLLFSFIYFLDPFDFHPLWIYKEMITQTFKQLLESWGMTWSKSHKKPFKKSVLGCYGKALCTVTNYL